MRGEREETAEELGKKIAMRALFARMKKRREKAKEQRELKKAAQKEQADADKNLK